MTIKRLNIGVIFLLLFSYSCSRQDIGSEELPETSEVANVPRLAQSPWPIYHANTNATASSKNLGPGDIAQVQSIASQTNKFGKSDVSPWTVVGDVYPDGSQPFYTTPNEGIAKYLIDGETFKPVDILSLDRKFFDYDWTIAVLEGNRVVTTEIKNNRFVVIGDQNESATSPLEIKYFVNVDLDLYGRLTSHFTISHDGHIIALTQDNKLVAVDIVRREVAAFIDLSSGSGVSFHNSFPIDKEGRIYLSTQKQLSAYDWNGEFFVSVWDAPYDMRGPGCEGYDENITRLEEVTNIANGELCTGSGTTPSLMGEQADGIVVILDGHAPKNNVVAFWRGIIPEDWEPLPDPNNEGSFLNRRVAGVFPLPYSTPMGDGFTAENSPAVLDNSLIAAQWGGFSPEDSYPKGVQRVDWIPDERKLELAWANPEAHFNGVPTIACRNGKCQTYGMGVLNGTFVYQALDFQTGEMKAQLALGTDQSVLDQGNNHAVASDGSIIYSGRFEMVRVR